jgi:hypothetical protein
LPDAEGRGMSEDVRFWLRVFTLACNVVTLVFLCMTLYYMRKARRIRKGMEDRWR